MAHTGSVKQRVSAWANAKVVGEFARAHEAGHGPIDFDPRPASGTGRQQGYRAVCPCGWSSTPRRSKVVAASAGYWHVLEVCQVLDERRELDGIEWSAAPPTPKLRHELRGVSL